jgi:hypothetical protein
MKSKGKAVSATGPGRCRDCCCGHSQLVSLTQRAMGAKTAPSQQAGSHLQGCDARRWVLVLVGFVCFPHAWLSLAGSRDKLPLPVARSQCTPVELDEGEMGGSFPGLVCLFCLFVAFFAHLMFFFLVGGASTGGRVPLS